MNWIVSFTVRVTETEIATHHILSADSEQLAERGIQEMGRTWWEMLEEEVDGCCWRFPEGEVSYFSLVPLADVETRILLDAMCIAVTGAISGDKKEGIRREAA